MSSPGRINDLRHFYELMDQLRARVGDYLTLNACSGRLPWPSKGVYFFFEPGETRSGSGTGPRVTRVGTHALTETSRAVLWKRLSQHAGTRRSGGGNHRGSIFRLLVGEALKTRDGQAEPRSWGVKGDAGSAAQKLGTARHAMREGERTLEEAVSIYIRQLPFLFVAVEDADSGRQDRGSIERNSIALLSNFSRDAIDPSSAKWLGIHSGRQGVRQSGLWNNQHVDERHDAAFLRGLELAVAATGRIR